MGEKRKEKKGKDPTKRRDYIILLSLMILMVMLNSVVMAVVFFPSYSRVGSEAGGNLILEDNGTVIGDLAESIGDPGGNLEIRSGFDSGTDDDSKPDSNSDNDSDNDDNLDSDDGPYNAGIDSEPDNGNQNNDNGQNQNNDNDAEDNNDETPAIDGEDILFVAPNEDPDAPEAEEVGGEVEFNFDFGVG